jgi:outer membrane receptor protein involved in Fe transport
VDGVPVVNVTGLLPLGDALQPGISVLGSWEVRDNLSFHRGAHSFKGGYNWRKQYSFSQSFQRSSFSFIPRYTGDSYGDFLLGFPASTIRGSDLVRAALSENGSYFYFQDDWTATSRLTLSLGVRYEYRGPWNDKRGFATNFNPATGLLDPPQLNQNLQPWQTGRYPAGVPILAWTKNGIVPRVGVAYRFTSKTVVRAGYGAYTNEPIVNTITKSYGSNPRTNAVAQTFLAPVNAATFSLSDPFNAAKGGSCAFLVPLLLSQAARHVSRRGCCQPR